MIELKTKIGSLFCEEPNAREEKDRLKIFDWQILHLLFNRLYLRPLHDSGVYNIVESYALKVKSGREDT